MSTLDNPIVPLPNPPIGPTAMRYGLMTGLALAAIGLVLYLAGVVDMGGQKNGWLSSLLNIVIMGGGIFMAQNAWKALNNGYMSLGKAWKIGMVASLIIGLITLVYSLIMFYGIAPDALDEIRQAQMEAMEQQGLSEDQMEQASGMMSAMSSPMMISIIGAIGTLIFGAIISLVTGLITQNKPPQVVA